MMRRVSYGLCFILVRFLLERHLRLFSSQCFLFQFGIMGDTFIWQSIYIIICQCTYIAGVYCLIISVPDIDIHRATAVYNNAMLGTLNARDSVRTKYVNECKVSGWPVDGVSPMLVHEVVFSAR